MKQIILCGSETQRDTIAALFPTLEARYANGSTDWSEFEGRSVVCVGIELAHLVQGYAAKCKVLPQPPSDLTQADALAWAKANAVPYHPQNPVEQDLAGAAPPAPQAEAAGDHSPVKAEEVATIPPATPAPVLLDPHVGPMIYLDATGTARAVEEAPPCFDPSEAEAQPQGRSSAFVVESERLGKPADLWGSEERLPVIPPECYPHALAPFITDEAEVMGCDPGMMAIYCTAICAGCLTDEIKLQVRAASDRWQEPARVWCMIVGDSGLTMKSPSLDTAISHAWKLERELRVAGSQALSDYATERQIFDAQQAEYVRKRAKNEPAEKPAEPLPPIAERLIIGNATLEAISDVLLQQGERGALVLADEIIGILSGFNQYKGGKGSDRTEWLEMWNGGPHPIDRKGRAVLVKNWGVSVIGGTQPEAIARIGKDLETDGLLQRFTIYLPRYSVAGPDRAGDIQARKRYHGVLDHLGKMVRAPDLAPVRYAPGASVIVEQARAWIRETTQASWLSAGLRAHLAKWPAMLARYCLAYAAIEAADEHHMTVPAVSEEIAAQVWGMMRGALWPHAQHFYLTTMAGLAERGAIKQIAGLILATGTLEISTRTMTQRSSHFRGAPVSSRKDILTALCELGWLHPQGGKSMITGLPTNYRVNEEVHSLYAHIAEQERAERKERSDRWEAAKAKE